MLRQQGPSQYFQKKKPDSLFLYSMSIKIFIVLYYILSSVVFNLMMNLFVLFRLKLVASKNYGQERCSR